MDIFCVSGIFRGVGGIVMNLWCIFLRGFKFCGEILESRSNDKVWNFCDRECLWVVDFKVGYLIGLGVYGS